MYVLMWRTEGVEECMCGCRDGGKGTGLGLGGKQAWDTFLFKDGGDVSVLVCGGGGRRG